MEDNDLTLFPRLALIRDMKPDHILLFFKWVLFSVIEKKRTQHISGPIAVLHWLGLGVKGL